MDIKILAVLLGVGIGWALSQLTDYVKENLRRRQKIAAIYTELADVNAWLERMLKQVKYALQLIVLDQQVTGIPGRINKFIFDEYFHEICMYLSRDARIGLTDTYESIDVINELIDQIKGIIDNQIDNPSKRLCQKFEAIYSVAFEARFKTRFLYHNRKARMDELKGVAKKLDIQLQEELDSFAHEAKELGLEGVTSSFYDE